MRDAERPEEEPAGDAALTYSQKVRHTYWRVLVQAEIRKLARRGEKVDPVLLSWALPL